MQKSQDQHEHWGKLKLYLKGELKEPPKLTGPVDEFKLHNDNLLYKVGPDIVGRDRSMRIVIPESFI